MVNNPELRDAFKRRDVARQAAFHAAEAVLAAQNDLKILKANIINTTPAAELGKNDKERDAYLMDKTRPYLEELTRLEQEKRGYDLDYDLRASELDCMKWQIRNDQALADLAAQGFVGVD